MASRRRIRAFAMLALLTGVVACSTTGGTPGAQSIAALTATSAAQGESSSSLANPTSGPATEPATSAPPETVQPESPQSPVDKPVVILAGRNLDGSVSDFSVDDPYRCGVFLISEDRALGIDLSVNEVALSPSDAFSLEGSACDAGSPRCTGFVFKGGSGTCSLDIAWDPASGVSEGRVALTLYGLCESNEGPLCGELTNPPGEGGTVVAFETGRGLYADVEATSAAPSDADSSDTDSSDTDSSDTDTASSEATSESQPTTPSSADDASSTSSTG